MSHHYIDPKEIRQSYAHSAGHGLSPVPHYGGGFFSKLKGFAKEVYNFAAPAIFEHGQNFAKDIIGRLDQRLNDPRRISV